MVRGMPGDDADTIVNNTLHQITGLSSRVFQPATSVHRVLFFYRLFGGNPLVTIHIMDRSV